MLIPIFSCVPERTFMLSITLQRYKLFSTRNSNFIFFLSFSRVYARLYIKYYIRKSVSQVRNILFRCMIGRRMLMDFHQLMSSSIGQIHLISYIRARRLPSSRAVERKEKYRIASNLQTILSPAPSRTRTCIALSARNSPSGWPKRHSMPS